jgi:catechol 2,3-dioxygenase-like lactoylglutathione lyase family enzyme
VKLSTVTYVVRDYDEAIAWFTQALGFILLEDSRLSDTKRWVRVAPPRGGAALLLARAATPAQSLRIGDQTGGRVGFFLDTDDFARDHALFLERGVTFVELPRTESYGMVAVFTDLYGNRWDLVGHIRDASPVTSYRFDEVLPILERTPATLRVLLSGLPEAWITTNEGAGTWGPYDIVGHLIHGEHTDWITRTRHILAQGAEVPFRPFDREAMFAESAGKSLDQLLDEFAELRRVNVAHLGALGLSETDLDRPGLHPALGPVTLGQLLATWVAHDLGHIAQITRVMAKRYRATVGPWRAFLPILDRG